MVKKTTHIRVMKNKIVKIGKGDPNIGKQVEYLGKIFIVRKSLRKDHYDIFNGKQEIQGIPKYKLRFLR